MCISTSVGRGGRNELADVAAVQILLNENLRQMHDPTGTPLDALLTDGRCWFWKDRGVDKLAERDDLKAVTRRINGGFNGLDDRMHNLHRAKAVLGLYLAR